MALLWQVQGEVDDGGEIAAKARGGGVAMRGSAVARFGACALTCFALLQGCTATAPPDRAAEASSGQRRAAVGPAYHTVRPGETLSRIARRYGLTVAQLIDANALPDPDRIEIGERLRLPAAALRAASLTLTWPLERWTVTSEFGARGGRHEGIDLSSPKGTGIRAAGTGVVEFAGRRQGYGRVVILHHGDGVRTLYAHNRRNLVRQGERVRQGQVIAKVGESGRATGSHLHFELIVDGRKRNPRRYLVTRTAASTAVAG